MNAFANVTDAGAHGAPELQSRHPPERESIWHMGNAATRLAGFRHERTERPEGSSRCARLSHRRHSRTPPKSLASFFVPAPSLKDFILCFRSENNTSGHSLANNFRRTSDQGTTLSVSSRGRPTGDPAQPVVQGSTPVPLRARRRTDSPTTPSPTRPDRRAGASTVARVRWIPWRDSLMQHPLRQAGAMVHEPTRVTCDGFQANPSDLVAS